MTTVIYAAFPKLSQRTEHLAKLSDAVGCVLYNKPSNEYTWAPSSRVKQLGREADHWRQSSAEVKN